MISESLFGRKIILIGDNQYTMLEQIGEGAFSFVFKAEKVSSAQNNTYAIKKMHLQSQEFEKSAIQEIKAFQQFKHKNILQMVDSKIILESESKIAYLVFPYAEKGSLRGVLDARIHGLASKSTLLNILHDFKSICEALSVLHSHSPPYIHQDIKPDNILIGFEGTPLLTDFGSCRTARREITTRAQSLSIADEAAQFCTISYRAPELFDPPRDTELDCR